MFIWDESSESISSSQTSGAWANGLRALSWQHETLMILYTPKSFRNTDIWGGGVGKSVKPHANPMPKADTGVSVEYSSSRSMKTTKSFPINLRLLKVSLNNTAFQHFLTPAAKLPLKYSGPNNFPKFPAGEAMQ